MIKHIYLLRTLILLGLLVELYARNRQDDDDYFDSLTRESVVFSYDQNGLNNTMKEAIIKNISAEQDKVADVARVNEVSVNKIQENIGSIIDANETKELFIERLEPLQETIKILISRIASMEHEMKFKGMGMEKSYQVQINVHDLNKTLSSLKKEIETLKNELEKTKEFTREEMFAVGNKTIELGHRLDIGKNRTFDSLLQMSLLNAQVIARTEDLDQKFVNTMYPNDGGYNFERSSVPENDFVKFSNIPYNKMSACHKPEKKIKFTHPIHDACSESGFCLQLTENAGDDDVLCPKNIECKEGRSLGYECDCMGNLKLNCTCPIWAHECYERIPSVPNQCYKENVLVWPDFVCSWEKSDLCSDKEINLEFFQARAEDYDFYTLHEDFVHQQNEKMSDYICYGNGSVVGGDKKYCENTILCDQVRSTRYCTYQKNRNAKWFIKNDCKVYINALGRRRISFYPYPNSKYSQSLNSKGEFCDGCESVCEDYGLNFTFDRIDKIVLSIDADKFDSLDVHGLKTFMHEVDRSIILKGYKYVVEFFREGWKVKSEIHSCVPREYCKVYFDSFSFSCLSLSTKIMIYIFAFCIMIVFFLVLYLISTTCIKLLTCFSFCKSKKRDGISSEDMIGLLTGIEKERESWSSGKRSRAPMPLITLLFFFFFFQVAFPCDEVMMSQSNSQKCEDVKGADGKATEECTRSFHAMVDVIGKPHKICFRAYDKSKILLAQFQFVVRGLRAVCEKDSLYWTREYDHKLLWYDRCSGAGSCDSDGNFCNSYADDQNSSPAELNHKYTESDFMKPGHKFCLMTRENRWTTFCANINKVCMFMKIIAEPRDSRIYEVFKCHTWNYEVVADYKGFVEGEHIREPVTITVKQGETLRIGNVEMTLDDIFEPIKELGDNRKFVTDGLRTFYGIAADRRRLEKGIIGEVQCKTKEKAMNFTITDCMVSPDVKDCHSFENTPSCNFNSIEFDRYFENSSLPMNIARRVLRVNEHGVPVLELGPDAKSKMRFNANGLGFAMRVEPTTCSMRLSRITGCYDCETGADFEYACLSDVSATMGRVQCSNGTKSSDFSFIVGCVSILTNSHEWLMFHSRIVNYNCTLACGGVNTSFTLQGILDYNEVTELTIYKRMERALDAFDDAAFDVGSPFHKFIDDYKKSIIYGVIGLVICAIVGIGIVIYIKISIFKRIFGFGQTYRQVPQ